MSFSFAVFLFLLITAVLVAAPFVPAFRELRGKRDAEPLKVVSDSEVDIRHFARGFSQFVRSRLGAVMEECGRSGVSREGVLDDGTPYLVTAGGSLGLAEAELRDRSSRRMIFSCGDLRLPGETMFLPELYASGSVYGGEKNIYRAVLAEKDLVLAPGSMSLRWVHAGKEARIMEGALLYGRVSSDESIAFEGTCRFERLNAPRIEFGRRRNEEEARTAAGESEPGLVPMKPDEPGRRSDDSAGRWLYERDIELPAGRTVAADIVGTGRVRVGKRTRIEGSVKSHKDLRLDGGVEIMGGVVSGRNLFIGDGCRIRGPVIAERDVYIGSGAVIGTAGAASTVSALGITIAPGSAVFGTVWAHTDGLVLGAGAPQPEMSGRKGTA